MKMLTAIEYSLVLLIVAGCAVGPDFKQPAAPKISGYTPIRLATTESATNLPGGEAQRFVEGIDISGQWWQLFHSLPLNNLIERALTNSPDVKSAQAALAVARENVLAQRGAYYPSASAGFSASRHKSSEQLAPVPNATAFYYSLFTPQVAVSYTPDVFGLNRRTMESLKALQEQTRFALAATHITLSANLASAAIQEASLRAQIEATRELLAVNTNILKVIRNRTAKGYSSRLDVAAQEAQMAQTEATLPPLQKQLEQQRDLLAALAGGFTGQQLPEEFDLSTLQLPEELPVSLPSQLVRQRPDIRQAEENLRAASAQIGIAVANRIPNITLSADAGSMALEAGKIFAGGTGFWDLSAGITQPIFEGGALMHKERAARAAYIQAAEQYRGTVITAFQNVADTLHALEQDAIALKAAAAAKEAAGVTLALAKNQFASGYSNYLSLLNAEQAYQQAVINMVQAQASRYADTAALFQALGGGWWNRPDVPAS
jgi:NodT family efflux transporter outer membrane factor (OMF) lipoprotein